MRITHTSVAFLQKEYYINIHLYKKPRNMTSRMVALIIILLGSSVSNITNYTYMYIVTYLLGEYVSNRGQQSLGIIKAKNVVRVFI